MPAALLDYGLRILPGIAVIIAAFLLTPRRAPALRIALLILAFVLMRDAMTAEGLWRVAAVPGNGWAIWMRFAPDPGIMLALGLASLAAVAAVLLIDRDLAALVRWGRAGRAGTWLLGLAGVAVIVAPFLVLHRFVPIDERGGAVLAALLPWVLLVALAGNLLEEVLFRGFAQGLLARTHGEARAVLLSGLLFAAGHVFLASTVTSVGWPVLAFTLYEGLICAWIARRSGVLASTLAHGGAIFLLATGLV